MDDELFFPTRIDTIHREESGQSDKGLAKKPFTPQPLGTVETEAHSNTGQFR